MGDSCFCVLLQKVTLGRTQPRTWDTAHIAAELEGAWLIAGPSSWCWTHIAAGLTSGGDNLGRVMCALLFIMCIFYSASKMSPCWLLPFAFWYEQRVCVAEKEQQWGFAVWLCHLFSLFWLSTLLCVLWRAAIALAGKGKANPMCQTPLLLNSH